MKRRVFNKFIHTIRDIYSCQCNIEKGLTINFKFETDICDLINVLCGITPFLLKIPLLCI